MKHLLFCIIFISFSILCLVGSVTQSDLEAATTNENNELDGGWSIKERICASVSDQSACVSSTLDITILDGEVYYENEVVGTVTQQDETIVFEYNPEFLKSRFEELIQDAGYDVTIENIDMTKYKGKLKDSKMKGKLKGTFTAYFDLFKVTLTMEYSGKFKGKKQ